MARGWESKSVESQIDSAAERKAATVAAESPDQMELRSKRERLGHSRARVLQDLDRATNPRYREMLLASLKFLEDELSHLNGGSPPADRASIG